MKILATVYPFLPTAVSLVVAATAGVKGWLFFILGLVVAWFYFTCRRITMKL